MGNAQTQLNESQLQRIHEIVQEVSNAFISEFKRNYNCKIIQDTLQHSPVANEGVRKRIFEPIETLPYWPIHSGQLFKLGGRRRNWKARYVELSNQADNFELVYYEKKDGPMKGSVKLNGYKIVGTDAHEDLGTVPGAPKEYGFKLVPILPSSKMRVWLMKSISEEEVRAWKDYLHDACNMVKPPLDLDPYTASAFKVAFKTTRFQYGRFEKFHLTCSEPEILAMFISDVVDNQLLRDVFRGMDTQRKEARLAIQDRIISEMQALWDLIRFQLQESQMALQESARQGADLVIASDKAMRKRVEDALSNLVLQPAMDTITTKVFPPIMQALEPPLTAVYAEVLRALQESVRGIEGDVKVSLEQLMRDVTDRESVLMSSILARLNSVDESLQSVGPFFKYDYTITDVHYDILRATLDVALRALANLKGRNFSAGSTSVPEDIIYPWSKKLAEACKMCCIYVTKDVLTRMLVNLADWQTSVAAPAREYTKNIQADMDIMLSDRVARLISLPILVDGSVEQSTNKVAYDFVSGALMDKLAAAYGCKTDDSDDET